MDLEDAISKGWLTYYDVTAMLNRTKQGQEIVKRAGNHFKENDPEKKKVVQLRTELMASLVKESFDNFRKNFDSIVKGEYDKELVFDKGEDSLGQIIQNYSRAKVYSHKEIEALELTGSQVITGLLDYYIKYLFHHEKQYRMHAKHTLSKTVFMTTLQEHQLFYNLSKPAWDVYEDFDPQDLAFEEKLRIVRDYVACMTDKYAVEQYRKLSGQSI